MSGIMMLSVGNSYGSLPVNTVAPVVSGTATVGQTLSTTNGTWTGAPAPTFTYQWQRSGSNIGGATSNTYVIQSADVGSTLRCVVTATNAVGIVSANSNSTATVTAPTGQQEYTTAGTYSWVAPAGVTSVSVVCVGGGAVIGGGGGLGYKNNITVTPGASYTVVVGAGGINSGTPSLRLGGQSYFSSPSLVAGNGGRDDTGAGGTYVGDGGGNGGASQGGATGGGAGGYSGKGGDGRTGFGFTPGESGAGGGAGGGGSNIYSSDRGAGGGVGLLGQGANGAGGSSEGSRNGQGGSGGSASAGGSVGGAYGGGGGLVSGSQAPGFGGAVRIIWPGNTRSFPSTNTGNL